MPAEKLLEINSIIKNKMNQKFNKRNKLLINNLKNQNNK
jgi:hypothetical protein